MKREIIDKAIDVLSELWDGKPKAWADFYNVVDYQTVKTALDALRAIPKPDPITGLMPCGCGGKANEVGRKNTSDWVYECNACGVKTKSQPNNAWAKQDWNMAMGWEGTK